MVKHKLRVASCELRVTSYKLKALKHELKFKSTSSNPRVTSSNPQIQIHELWVQLYELWFQIQEFKNYLIYQSCTGLFSKYGIILKYRIYLRFCLMKIKSDLANFGSQKQF